METFLFPFEKIEKNSKIVIYGFGVVGRQYYLQLKKTNYCEVIMWVDQEGSKLSNHFVDICEKGKLYNLDKSEYDYVLIALFDSRIVSKVCAELEKNGIPKEKIVAELHREIGDWQFEVEFPTITEKMLRENSDVFEDYLKTFYILRNKNARLPQEYYHELSNFLNANSSEKVLNILKASLKKLKSGPEKLIALRLLYDLDIFDAECLEMFQLNLIEMDWFDDAPFCAVMDSSHMTHFGNGSKNFYANFYNDRKKLMKKICDFYGLSSTKTEKKTLKEIKKIALFGFYTNLNLDPAANLVIKYAEDFVNEGYATKIFITNSLKEVDLKNCFLRKKYEYISATKEELKIINLKSDVFISEDIAVKERLQNFIDAVVEYSPDLIIDMTDEFCPQSYIINEHFPIVYMPMRVGMSSSAFDYIIERNMEDFQRKNSNFNCVEECKCLNVKLGAMLPVKKMKDFRRSDYGIKESSFIIATVGSRLDKEVDEDLISEMCNLLKKHDDIIWIIVGANVVSDDSCFAELESDNRIVNWGWEENIEDFYKICNAYLQPNRNGGGHSTRLAMRQGLPIVLSDYPSDCRSLFETKYLCSGLKEMIDELERLFLDKQYREEKALLSKKIINDLTKESDCKKIIDAYKMKLFGQ